MRRLCASDELKPGRSLRFELKPLPGRFGPLALEGFALRTQTGALRAYVNLCPHRGQPLDLGDGRLFHNATTLECQAHGARFDALTGACVSGPCDHRSLGPLTVEERDSTLWLLEHPSDEEAPDDDPNV